MLCLSATSTSAQHSSRIDKLISAPDKLFGALNKKSRDVEDKLDKQTDKYLSKLERQEHRLKRKLSKKDSLLAEQTFGDIDRKYEGLKNTSGKASRYTAVYSGHLDSLSTALNFLNNDKLSSLSSNPELEKTLAQYKELQLKLNASDLIKKQLAQRQAMLKEQFQKLGMVKQLKQFQKQVYYYQTQVREYKEMFEDPSKLETKLLELVMKMPQFKEFFASNSVLGSLFALPGSTQASTVSVAGLQTRASVQQSLIDRFGSGPNVTAQLQQNMQAAQGQLSELKNRIGSFSSGSYGNAGDGDIPGFKPNTQKTKTFFQRLEYGANIQSQRARYFFPVSTDLGLSLGYKINDKSSVGIGASYKIGWGSGWENISVTHQGVGLRSDVDMKIKGSFYISGGYEQNYLHMINSVNQLKDYSAWQKSALIGVSKRYRVSNKLEGEMKIMWDFLSYQQIPKSQPVVFRIAYRIK
jgi:hypothetical protein